MRKPKRVKPRYTEDSDITTWIARHVSGAGWVEYELNEKGNCIWILMVYVRVRYRGRGVAQAMLRSLFLQMNKVKGWIIPGMFTDKGEKLILPYKRLVDEFPEVGGHIEFLRDYEGYLARTPELHAELKEFRDSLYRR